MAKVEIDTDVEGNELLPLVEEEVKNLNAALDEASVISFPDSGFGWGNVISKISDCVNIANKYNNWINRVHTSYIKNINDNTEVLAKFKLDDVKIKETIVK